MDLRKVSRLAKWTAIGGGGEDFYIAQCGRRTDLPISREGEGALWLGRMAQGDNVTRTGG